MKPKTATAILALAAAMITAPVLASSHRGAMTGEGMQGAGPAAMLEALNFAEIDADGDGAITVDEWRAFVTTRMADRRAAMIEARVDALMEGDVDGDGALSRDELAGRIAAMGDERRERMQQMRGERSEMRGERGPRAEGRGHGRHGGGYGEGRGGRMGMDGADADTRIMRSFQRFDADADGRVTEAEFTQGIERMQARAARHAERREGRRGGEGRSGN